MQIMLDVVIERVRKFAFNVHITNTKEGNIKIGVVDRYAQGQMENSYSSGNAVCFDGMNWFQTRYKFMLPRVDGGE